LTRPNRLIALIGAVLVAAACTTGGGSSSDPYAAGSGVPASVGPVSTAPASVAPGSPAPGSAGPAGSGTASGACPKSQPASLPAGQKRLVTIQTAKGAIAITIDGSLSPIAAGNFVALAGCGFYNGVVFHRIVPGFVIQGGDPTGTGTGGPGYTIHDEPVTTTYKRGTVAMARTAAANSVGSQFFIVLADKARTALADPAYNNYQIIGTVSAGMDVADAITSAAGGVQLPPSPIAMDKVTVSTP
jgi:cyclophilin family peptidyl-prolyl cis-trans isomerase